MRAVYSPVTPRKTLTPHKYYTRNNTNPISPSESAFQVRRNTPPTLYNNQKNLLLRGVSNSSDDEDDTVNVTRLSPTSTHPQGPSRLRRFAGTTYQVLKNTLLWVCLTCLATNVYILSILRSLKVWKYPFSDTDTYDSEPTSRYLNGRQRRPWYDGLSSYFTPANRSSTYAPDRQTAERTPGVGWCGFFSSLLFLAALILLLGVLLRPSPLLPGSSSSSSDTTSIFGYLEDHKRSVSEDVARTEYAWNEKLQSGLVTLDKKTSDSHAALLDEQIAIRSVIKELEAQQAKLRDQLVVISTLDKQQTRDIDGVSVRLGRQALQTEDHTAALLTLNTKYDIIRAQLDTLNTQLEQMTLAQQKLTEDKQDMKQKQNQQEGVLTEHADRFKRMSEKELSVLPPELRSQLAKISAELEALKQQSHVTGNHGNDAVASLSSQYDKLGQEMTSLRAQLAQHLTDNGIKLERMKQDVNGVKIQVKEANVLTTQQLQTYESKLAVMSALQSRLTLIELSLKSAADRNNIPDNSNTIENLEADIHKILSDMKRSNGDHDAKLSALRSAVDQTNSDVLEQNTRHNAQQNVFSGRLTDTENKIKENNDNANNAQGRLSSDLASLHDKLRQLDDQINTKIKAIVLQTLSAVTQSSPDTRFFSDWLYSTFLSQEQFDREVNDTKVILPSQDELVQIVISELRTRHAAVPISSESGLTVADIQLVVANAIQTFNEDKTGRADFALEALGGTVISIGCTETYYEGAPYVHFMSVLLYRTPNSPNVALQPDIIPGKCWAFKGDHGYMLIKLSNTITVSGFSMEHLPKRVSPDQSINSAPKRFIIRGVRHPHDDSPHAFGEYVYQDADPLQYFPIQHSSRIAFEMVELEIISNHGNKDYTCLYRIRVHGKTTTLN